MPQVSKYPISTAVANRIFGVFIRTLVSVKNDDEAADLASDLFSPTEKVMFAKRIAIAFLLLQGYQYRAISKILRVSLATISSVNLSLKHGKGSYKKILERIMKEENLDEFFRDTVVKLISIPASSTKGAGAWRYLRNEIQKTGKKESKLF